MNLEKKKKKVVYLPLRFSFTVGGEGAAMVCGVGAGAGAGAEVAAGAGTGAATAEGLMVGANENAEEAEGVSEGGFEAKENPEGADPNAVDPPRENADGAAVAHVDGTEKEKLDEANDVGFVGPMPNGAAEKEAAGAGGVETAAGVRLRLENVAGADGMEAATLGAGVAKDPVNRKQISFLLISSLYRINCLPAKVANSRGDWISLREEEKLPIFHSNNSLKHQRSLNKCCRASLNEFGSKIRQFKRK